MNQNSKWTIEYFKTPQMKRVLFACGVSIFSAVSQAIIIVWAYKTGRLN